MPQVKIMCAYLDDHIWDLAEEYESRLSISSNKRSSVSTTTRAKYANRNHKTRLQEQLEREDKAKKGNVSRHQKANATRMQRKREKRAEQVVLQLEAKKGKKSSRVEDWQMYYENRRSRATTTDSQFMTRFLDDRDVHEMNGTLPLDELGIQDIELYERLTEILSGAEISPEDYDVLLQLDNSIIKPTMELDAVNTTSEIVVLDGTNRVLLEGKSCLVCLQAFCGGDEDTSVLEVRKLACGHLFCKQCIDQWLTTASMKCPELSCFWNSSS